MEGKFNYNLHYDAGHLYLNSNILVQAQDPHDNSIVIPAQFKWFWIKGDRVYNLNAINGNVYQLSAEDVGCKVWVEVNPIDEGDGWKGTATAEFGPVALKPSVWQQLEYILGSGGSKFQVTVYYPDDRMKMIDEWKSWEGVLIVTNDYVMLEEKWYFNQKKPIFKIEYTSFEEPHIDITSNDT